MRVKPLVTTVLRLLPTPKWGWADAGLDGVGEVGLQVLELLEEVWGEDCQSVSQSITHPTSQSVTQSMGNPRPRVPSASKGSRLWQQERRGQERLRWLPRFCQPLR